MLDTGPVDAPPASVDDCFGWLEWFVAVGCAAAAAVAVVSFLALAA